MATAQWGLFEWGLGEWGRAAEGAAPSPDMAASATLSLGGAASLQLTRTFDASASLSLSGAAALTTVIQMAAAADLTLNGEATDFFVARFPSRLVECGNPISTACQDWLLE